MAYPKQLARSWILHLTILIRKENLKTKFIELSNRENIRKVCITNGKYGWRDRTDTTNMDMGITISNINNLLSRWLDVGKVIES